jgi:hypothetical protein
VLYHSVLTEQETQDDQGQKDDPDVFHYIVTQEKSTDAAIMAVSRIRCGRYVGNCTASATNRANRGIRKNCVYA